MSAFDSAAGCAASAPGTQGGALLMSGDDAGEAGFCKTCLREDAGVRGSLTTVIASRGKCGVAIPGIPAPFEPAAPRIPRLH